MRRVWTFFLTAAVATATRHAMPISAGTHSAFARKQRENLLRAAKEEEEEEKRKHDDNDTPETIEELEERFRAVQAEAETVRRERIGEYRRMISDTESIPLQKLAFSRHGVELFDELCMRVDVNQAYAQCLPQWGDLAAALEVDELRTQWVRACVRPSEGLTRAMLEIYMRDGGTLGEVLGALLKLELLQVLEKLRPRVRAFLKERELEAEKDGEGKGGGDDKVNAKFFSMLATLAKAFGKYDPCYAIQNLSGGLKRSYCRAETKVDSPAQSVSEPLTHTLTVLGGRSPGTNLVRDHPLSTTESAFDSAKHGGGTWDLLNRGDGGKWREDAGSTCRILLVYARDGVAAAEETYQAMQGFEHEGVRAEVFRLAETSLWLEVLTQPEACCMKWAGEADYVVPVLTPDFLEEIHRGEGGGGVSLLPTSPLLNRFIYTLLRARFVDSGCRNTAVRPVIPSSLVPTVGGCKAVRTDPLFRMSWTELAADGERLRGRTRAMLAEVAKNTRRE